MSLSAAAVKAAAAKAAPARAAAAKAAAEKAAADKVAADKAAVAKAAAAKAAAEKATADKAAADKAAAEKAAADKAAADKAAAECILRKRSSCDAAPCPRCPASVAAALAALPHYASAAAASRALLTPPGSRAAKELAAAARALHGIAKVAGSSVGVPVIPPTTEEEEVRVPCTACGIAADAMAEALRCAAEGLQACISALTTAPATALLTTAYAELLEEALRTLSGAPPEVPDPDVVALVTLLHTDGIVQRGFVSVLTDIVRYGLAQPSHGPLSALRYVAQGPTEWLNEVRRASPRLQSRMLRTPKVPALIEWYQKRPADALSVLLTCGTPDLVEKVTEGAAVTHAALGGLTLDAVALYVPMLCGDHDALMAWLKDSPAAMINLLSVHKPELIPGIVRESKSVTHTLIDSLTPKAVAGYLPLLCECPEAVALWFEDAPTKMVNLLVSEGHSEVVRDIVRGKATHLHLGGLTEGAKEVYLPLLYESHEALVSWFAHAPTDFINLTTLLRPDLLHSVAQNNVSHTRLKGLSAEATAAYLPILCDNRPALLSWFDECPLVMVNTLFVQRPETVRAVLQGRATRDHLPHLLFAELKTLYLFALYDSPSAVFSWFDASPVECLQTVVEGVGCLGTDTLLAHCAAMRELNLSGYHDITDDGLATLATHCHGLRTLTLSYCAAITDAGIHTIASLLPSLTTLDLGSCDGITSRALEKLTYCESLTTLSLACCRQMTDAGAKALARAPALRDVNLYNCAQITDAGVKDLVKGCHTLTSMEMMGCCVTGAVRNEVLESLGKRKHLMPFHAFVAMERDARATILAEEKDADTHRKTIMELGRRKTLADLRQRRIALEVSAEVIDMLMGMAVAPQPVVAPEEEDNNEESEEDPVVLEALEEAYNNGEPEEDPEVAGEPEDAANNGVPEEDPVVIEAPEEDDNKREDPDVALALGEALAHDEAANNGDPLLLLYAEEDPVVLEAPEEEDNKWEDNPEVAGEPEDAANNGDPEATSLDQISDVDPTCSINIEDEVQKMTVLAQHMGAGISLVEEMAALWRQHRLKVRKPLNVS